MQQQSCPMALVMSLNPLTTGLLGCGVSAFKLSNRLSRSSWRAGWCWLSTTRLLGSARTTRCQNPVQPVLLRECLQGRARAVRDRAQSGHAPGGLAVAASTVSWCAQVGDLAGPEAAHQAPGKGCQKEEEGEQLAVVHGLLLRQSSGYEGVVRVRVARLARRED